MTQINQGEEKLRLTLDARKWQKIALANWTKCYKGIVNVVTGGGKTVFSFLCITEFLKHNPPKKVIVIVPTLTLLDQWYVSFQEELTVKENDIACFSGEEKPKEYKLINIIVINTARNLIPKIKDKENFLLIVDECHRAGSAINSKAIIGTFGGTLGLSATPEREHDDGFQKIIVPNLGDVIYEYGYADALNDHVICNYELHNIEVPFLAHEKQTYNRISQKIAALKKREDTSFGEGAKKLNMLLIKRARISANAVSRIPVTSKIVEENNLERIIVFHESIDAAEHIFQILTERNKNVTIYHSRIGKNLRRDNLRLYRQGRVNILITCKALDEGMNIPETTLAVIASSTSSYRQRIQRLGRVLRPAKGKSLAKIFTLFATEQEKVKLKTESKDISNQIKVLWYKIVANGQDFN